MGAAEDGKLVGEVGDLVVGKGVGSVGAGEVKQSEMGPRSRVLEFSQTPTGFHWQ